MTTIIVELLNCMCVAWEHDTKLGKYWFLAYNIHADYNMVHNMIGKFLTFKEQLYIPRKFGTKYII